MKPEGGGLPGPGAAASMTKALTNRAKALGVEILLETPVKKLLKKDGRIIGVMAESASGEVIQAHAKGIIVARAGSAITRNGSRSIRAMNGAKTCSPSEYREMSVTASEWHGRRAREGAISPWN